MTSPVVVRRMLIFSSAWRTRNFHRRLPYRITMERTDSSICRKRRQNVAKQYSSGAMAVAMFLNLTFEGSILTVGTKLRKMWLQSVRAGVLLKATSSSSIASSNSRSPSFCRYSNEASYRKREKKNIKKALIKLRPYIK